MKRILMKPVDVKSKSFNLNNVDRKFLFGMFEIFSWVYLNSFALEDQ